MADRRAVLLGTALVTVLMVLSSMGLLAAMAGGPAAHGSGATASATIAPPGSPTRSTPGSTGFAGGPLSAPTTTPTAPVVEHGTSSAGSVSPVVAKVESQIADHQLNPSSAFLPSAFTHQGPAGAGGINPTYPGTPAPMGLADLGVGSSGRYEYNTTSFESSMNFSSFTDYNPGYAGWDAPPNYMTFQLNTVTVNVTYPGGSNGVFWIQNVVHFNGTELQFENNIWNMTSPSTGLNPGTLATYSGTLVPGEFYYTYGPTFQVHYPFTLNLYNNITSGGGVPGVYFNYTITNADLFGFLGDWNAYYDHVTFNGVASVSSPPQFQVNGLNYNPIGLLWDAELIFGGNGGGANAVITQLSSSATLDFWNGASYVSVPSAYDYGEDTGETAVGVAAVYSGTTEFLNQGPSMEYGLWNTANTSFGPAANPGWINLIWDANTNWSFYFVENNTTFNSGTNNWSYAPSELNGYAFTELPPVAATDNYAFAGYSDGYDPWTFNVWCHSNASCDFGIGVGANPSVFDAPIYLGSDGQAFGVGNAGIPGISWTGSVTASNLSINDTMASIAPAFLGLNDFHFATFFLFAEEYLNTTSVYLNSFLQDPSTYNYSYYGQTVFIPGWTQGYYFNYGAGIFTVTNTTITGNADVEFWSTFSSFAANIVTSGDSFGVDVLQGNDTFLDNITSETGANAIAVLNSFEVGGLDISSNGTDLNGVPSWAAYLYESYEVFLLDTSATNGALGIYAYTVEDFEFVGLTATNAYEALYLYDTGFGDIYDFLVTGGYGIGADYFGYITFYNLTFQDNASAGYLTDGGPVNFWGINVTNSTGLSFYNGEYINIAHVNATGNATQEASGFSLLGDVQYVTLTNVTASNNAVGALVEGGQNVSAQNITADGNAVGYGVLGVENVTVANVSVSNEAAGVIVEVSENVTVRNVSVSGVGLGVATFYDLNTVIYYVNSTAAVPGPEYFSTSEFTNAPNAAVASYGNNVEEIALVSALNDGFAVTDNASNEIFVFNVTAWNAQVGISFNGTQNSTIALAFLFGSEVGTLLYNTTNVYLEADTIEASIGFGLSVHYGTDVYVVVNNFVSNNGASTDGTFSAAHVQVSVVSATNVNFNLSGGIDGNYWSDWTPTSGAYPVTTGVSDTNPQTAFIENWLEFDETGLPAGTQWGFVLNGIPYETTAQLVFIPAWSLGDPTLPYTVASPVGYTPTPASGSVVYTGTNQTITISFAAIPYTVSFTASGLPSGTGWSVTFDGTPMTGTTSGSTGTISFTATEGSYSYSIGGVAGYTASPNSGSVTVNGAGQTVDIAFSVVTYTVTISESGLVSGTSWSVTIGAQTVTSTGSTAVFQEPNGTYTFTIGGVSGYTANRTTGSLTVAGGPMSASVTFTAVTPVTYSVTFTESGLASGASWSVTLGGSTKTGTAGGSIVFSGLSNGSYPYTIGSVSGYTSSPTSSSVTVAGTSPTVGVTFTASTTPPPPASGSGGSSGLSTLDWAIIGLVIILIIVGLIVALARRRRGGGSNVPPPAAWTPPAAAGGTAAAPPPWSEGPNQPPQDPSEGPR